MRKRVAYCLYGQPRELLNGYNNIMSFLKKFKNIDVDFFYHTWYDDDCVNKDMYYDIASWRIKSRGRKVKMMKNVIFAINKLYNPVCYDYEKPKQFDIDSLKESACYKNNTNSDNFSKQLVKNMNNLMSQLYSRNRARDIFYNYIQSNNLLVGYKDVVIYDFVITSRFDFLRKIEIDLNDIDPSKIYVSVKHLPRKIFPDNFMIMNTQNYMNIFNLYNNLHNIINNKDIQNKLEKNGEMLIFTVESLILASFFYYFDDFNNVVYTQLIPNFI